MSIEFKKEISEDVTTTFEGDKVTIEDECGSRITIKISELVAIGVVSEAHEKMKDLDDAL